MCHIGAYESMTSFHQIFGRILMGKGETKSGKSGKGGKTNTSLRLDRHKLKALKIRAIEEDTSVQKILETLVDAYLAKPGT